MSDLRDHISISISTGTLVRVIVILAITGILFLLRDLVLIILTAVVIATAIEPMTRWCIRYHMPRVLAVVGIYLLAFALIFVSIYIFVPPLFSDLNQLSQTLPDQITALGGNQSGLDPLSSITGGFATSFSLKDIVDSAQDRIAEFSGGLFQTGITIFGSAISFIIVLVVSFYLAVQENGVENFLRIVTPAKSEKYIINLWRRSQFKIGRWFKGQLVLGLIIGVLVYLGLTILGVRYALTLGILAAVFELVPFFGPILSAVPGILFGFGEGVQMGLVVIGFYIIIQQFENHLIYPLVVKKIVGVPPLLVILSLIVGGQLAGFLGFILAVPIATVLMELAGDVERQKLAANNITANE
ncbi:MAG: AI-2E family transporter [Candidatus Vogelbacteria bacterium]|nr:AI-2E family transporter [Candidatus Vogelbacteria bacterium]